jgi:hypothetical protein
MIASVTTCDFFGENFRHFVKNIFIIRYPVTKFPVLKKKSSKKEKNSKNSPKNATIAYHIKGCLRFYTFIYKKSPNLAKHMYVLSPPEQYHKIQKKTHTHTHTQFSVTRILYFHI